jgi:hypothetical protein
MRAVSSELRVPEFCPSVEPDTGRADVTVLARAHEEGTDIGGTAAMTGDRDSSRGIEWVSIPVLAVRVGMAKESVYRLARAGQLRGAVKMGRRYVVNYSAFVEASRAPITPAALRS